MHLKQRFPNPAQRSLGEANLCSRWFSALALSLVAMLSLSGCVGRPGPESSQSGGQPGIHSVGLAWDPSASSVAGYNVYRGAQPGGPYTKLNTTPVPVALFTDNAVDAGKTYFYVTTAVDSNNLESMLSNEVSAVIPTP